MSKAAFCTECGANVWVKPNGECANGHARSSLRNEYETEAPPSAVPVTRLATNDATALKRLVAEARGAFMSAQQQSAAAAARAGSSEKALDEATSRLAALRSGKGSVLANLYNMAVVYEYWIEVPGYSGRVAGSTARMSQTGDLHSVSHVEGTSKSGFGGAVAGGVGGALVGGALLGAAGAILGNNMARKTKVTTTVKQVDTRQLDLEVVGSGYAWSSAFAHDAIGKVRQFKDVVNARGSAEDDLAQQTMLQQDRVAEAQRKSHVDRASAEAAALALLAAQSRYQQTLNEQAVAARTFWDKTKILFSSVGSGKLLPAEIRSTRTVLIVGGIGLALLSCTVCGLLGSLAEPTALQNNTPTGVGTSGDESTETAKPKVPTAAESLLPAVAKWVKFNSQWGKPTSIVRLHDWAGGKAQKLTLDKGLTLRFYLVKDEVNIVYEESAEGELKVFGHYAAWFELPKPVKRRAADGLPAYTILHAAENITGEIAGNVLVPTMTRSTPSSKRAAVFKRIAEREGLLTAAFYSTEAAYKADSSKSYRRSHPTALRRGSTGLLMDGKFTRGETLHP